MAYQYLQSDLDALHQALAAGERRVTFADGRSVEYESTDEMLKRIRFIQKNLREQSGKTRRLYSVASFADG